MNTAAIAVENERLQSAAVLQNRLDQELRDAREIQRSFLPGRLPSVPGYSFFAHYDSAASVGGDYYGFLELPGRKLAVGIGDVSGKGLPAALVMARLSSDVRTSLLKTDDPARAMHAIDLALAEARVGSRFVTMVLMLLDYEKHRLLVANAGHPRTLLRHPDGRVVEIESDEVGIPLNVQPADRLAASVDLAPGTTVVAYTDGVSEAEGPDGAPFGAERVRALLSAASGDARAIGANIVADLRAFAGSRGQRDDTTLLAFGRG